MSDTYLEDTGMSRLEKLKCIRRLCKLTQADMADSMGLSLRAYQDIENGKSKARRIHLRAAERVSLTMAVLAKDINMCTSDIRSEALDLAAIIRERTYI